MVSSRQQIPPCPVCHRNDQVMRLQAASEAGLTRYQPPPMPVATVRMMPYILVGFALVALGSFFILIWSGVGGYGGWPGPVQVIQVVLTIVAIVVALVLSLVAFLRVVQGDLKTQKLLPLWDQAMENWRSLYFCKRDNVVFNPQTNKVLTDAEVKALLSPDSNVTAAQLQSEKQSATASHQ
jgi:hypothetical protein